MTKPETEKLPRLPPLPQAFFDEFGANADDRVQDYAHAYALAATRAKGGRECQQCEGTGIRQNDEGRNEFCPCRTTPAPAPEVVRVSPPITDEMIERFADAYYGRGKTYEPERVRVALSFAIAKPATPAAAPEVVMRVAGLMTQFLEEEVDPLPETLEKWRDMLIAHARSAGGEGNG
jgi:hypothetical protein